jgi:plasmid maintenance system antidote protein VapI
MARKKLPLTTPGEILLEEFLKPLGVSQYQLKEVRVLAEK